ncbi:MAG: pseudouridine synthase [Verrucomicrobia bacterium]|jgi:16S rRNA pseudouridine516 synthase|nr:pseudouridine synthase [Verrucomicrobiota bacterium]MDA7539400.1 pseudouridine synthase [Akkermansiaceae bacterium]MDB4658624.1 pseudouridine synthase [bacterium]MBT6165929.1 pseudouridine synthase [Verrucomicrobiota bacterium]MBT6400660.1 pseudouridine synthase [Verrucomicrobiota bacterium]
MRLDRLVGKWAGAGKRRTREIFESRKVVLNGRVCEDAKTLIGRFDQVEVDGAVVQNEVPRYVMLHKPRGIVSATIDSEHRTVIDLIGVEWAGKLHLAGRLDRFTSGLVVLTNDSCYSESLTDPSKKVGKRYLVEVDGEIGSEVVSTFEAGMWFAKEKVITAPAVVHLLGPSKCRLTIFEGKHHQIKRMFASFSLKVISLHREAVGDLELLDELKEGQWIEFSPSR